MLDLKMQVHTHSSSSTYVRYLPFPWRWPVPSHTPAVVVETNQGKLRAVRQANRIHIRLGNDYNSLEFLCADVRLRYKHYYYILSLIKLQTRVQTPTSKLQAKLHASCLIHHIPIMPHSSQNNSPHTKYHQPHQAISHPLLDSSARKLTRQPSSCSRRVQRPCA